eukprot:TRINITY_DN19_c0_g1::TRINITY_DN19_c0_g1_i1::g.14750::m.14750 TRINITY_DN19_c0_g1::TRINITY_DN19_c0_g1_i1::g.14750  ORF type:complete len:223 (+),score=53.64,sp/Q9FMC5/VP602_ARATH/47.60/1e-57,Snf7/PF03357.16/3.5e-46,Cytochrom_B562/PF07361.6/5.8e+02,Cytochrom_B562/PF07361.6/0.003,Prefoldin_2/PF01920.15/0.024,Prefoldin_2/PF01920.15/4.8e+03,Sugarporin_N/PF11471.3/0.095,Sugarporin_N/PF11471.3/8e+03,Sugarporin_N/PF11471.3/4.2e+03,Striatin/PF08232.7/2.8,Striatin/PF08232.7/5.4e+02,Vps4_C/PF09336.5/1.6e+03,
MHRIFGAPKPKNQVSLDDTIKNVEARGDSLEVKIKKLDVELKKYQEQLKKVKPGTSVHNSLKQRALRVLKQKKMYEAQRDQTMQQAFNMDQTRFATESLKETIVTVDTMKQAAKDMKKTMKKIKIEDVERVQDDLADMLDYSNEVQECLGRSYGIGEEIDEGDLEDELAALEFEMEGEMDADAVPDYLAPNENEDILKDLEAPPSHVPDANKNKEAIPAAMQ